MLEFLINYWYIFYVAIGLVFGAIGADEFKDDHMNPSGSIGFYCFIAWPIYFLIIMFRFLGRLL